MVPPIHPSTSIHCPFPVESPDAPHTCVLLQLPAADPLVTGGGGSSAGAVKREQQRWGETKGEERLVAVWIYDVDGGAYLSTISLSGGCARSQRAVLSLSSLTHTLSLYLFLSEDDWRGK
jgi:hypothetical protein